MRDLSLDSTLSINRDLIQAPNLTDRFSDDDLARIGSFCWQGYTTDLSSRTQWERRMGAAMNLAMQIQEVKTFPWPGASNVIFPLITIAALQFSAKAYTNIIQGTDVVRYRTVGKDPGGKLEERAVRIGSHMSWQVLEEDEAWEEQHDRLFINLAVVGSAFIKTYFDAGKGHNVSEMVPARDFVIDYWAKSTEQARRKSQNIELDRNDIYEGIVNDYFRDVRGMSWYNSVATPQTNTETDKRRGQQPPAPDFLTPFQSVEQHTWFDFDKDGYYEPYIVTFDLASKSVIRIAARYNEEGIRKVRKEISSIKPLEYYTKYGFIPSPDGGIYDMGFGIFMGPINESVNTAINQMIDSGTLQNSMGGFLGRGVKIRGGNYTMGPFEWKRVDSTGDDLRKQMVPYPERQPSEVLLKLAVLLIEYAEKIAGTQEEQLGSNPGQNTPASTYQGMLEQGAGIYKVIFKRVWRCMKGEFKKLYMLNREFLPTKHTYGIGSELWVSREDYLQSPDRIAPVADPNLTSATMRITQAMTLRQLANSKPGYQRDKVELRVLRALQIDNPEEVYLGEANGPPLPNPKAAVEQLKTQRTQMQGQFKLRELILTLKEGRLKMLAEVHNLEAQAAKALKEADAVGAAEKLQAFEMIINLFQQKADRQQEMISDLEKQYDEGEGSDGGGVGGMAGQSGNEGGDGVPGSVPMGSAPAMGGGRPPGRGP